MHVKSIILVALMIASLALARGITSRTEEEEEEDDNNNNNNNKYEETSELNVVSAPDQVIGLTPSSTQGCASAANVPTDRTLGSTNQPSIPSGGKSMFDKADDNKRINIGRRVNLDRIRNGIMRASSHPGSGILQFLDNFEFIRPSEIREGLSSIIPNIIDPLVPPQMQYVDNTLRLMALRNSMDDVLSKIFPNLHMIQHPMEQNSKYNQNAD